MKEKALKAAAPLLRSS